MFQPISLNGRISGNQCVWDQGYRVSDKNFPANFFKKLKSLTCCLWSSVIMQKQSHCTTSLVFCSVWLSQFSQGSQYVSALTATLAFHKIIYQDPFLSHIKKHDFLHQNVFAQTSNVSAFKDEDCRHCIGCSFVLMILYKIQVSFPQTMCSNSPSPSTSKHYKKHWAGASCFY